jgi:hypothetical protein
MDPEKLTAMEEVGSEELGHREGPETVAHRLGDLFAHQRRSGHAAKTRDRVACETRFRAPTIRGR